MGIMCVLSKTLCPTLKGCKWRYLVFHRKRLEPRALSWQQHRCHSVSFVMQMSGAKFEEDCSNISGDIFASLFYCLKMISSPYCAVSEPNVYKHYKRLTRWNAKRCHSLRITYLIFETFQTLFSNSFIDFYSCEGFIKRYIRKNEA